MDKRIKELWSLKLNPSDFRNIERVDGDNPIGGNGQLYIQIPKSLVDGLLAFLDEAYPDNGVVHRLEVYDIFDHSSEPEILEFMSKSAGRMRTSKQNRHRNTRLKAWDTSNNFPVLKPWATIEDAKKTLDACGQIHIFLARLENGKVFAGFTIGEPSKDDANQPFASLLWGDEKGGYWRAE